MWHGGATDGRCAGAAWQVYAVNQGGSKAAYDMGQDQTEINPTFDDPGDGTADNFDEF